MAVIILIIFLILLQCLSRVKYHDGNISTETDKYVFVFDPIASVRWYVTY